MMTHAQKPNFSLSAKRTSPFKSAGASVNSTTGSRGVRISGSNAGYTMFRGSVKSTGYPLHSPVSPSLPLPCVTVCHHILTGLYLLLGTSTGEESKASSTLTEVSNIKLLLSSVNMSIRRNLCRLVLSVGPQRDSGIDRLTVEVSKSHIHTRASAR